MKTAVQQIMLGSITGNEAKAAKALARIKESGYDGIELNRFMIHPTPLMVRLLTKAAGMPAGSGGKLDWHRLIKESGLEVISLHTDLGSLERDPEGAAAEAGSFGTDKLVITGMYRFDYGSRTEVQALAKRLNAAGSALREKGVTLFYHNHNVELLQVEPGVRAYDILLSETDPELVSFEFDSYWFADGGADPKQWMKKLGKRVKLWHINDRGARVKGASMTPILKEDSCELGAGNMDLEGLLAVAREAGVEGIVLESHRNWIDGDPLKCIELSGKWLGEKLA